jgi:transcriptional regulator with XRE-family HTH domain
MTQTNDIKLQEGIDFKLLDDARKDRKWSVPQTAEFADVPEGTTKKILNGTTLNPGAENLGKLCRTLGVPIEKVLRQDEQKEIEKQAIKNDDASILALKEIYECQISIINKSNEEHEKNLREHYERHISEMKEHMKEMKEHYEARLRDKREHIDTIMLDKKWFRLASVCSVLVLLGVFFFIEFMTPGHGWFTFGK